MTLAGFRTRPALFARSGRMMRSGASSSLRLLLRPLPSPLLKNDACTTAASPIPPLPLLSCSMLTVTHCANRRNNATPTLSASPSAAPTPFIRTPRAAMRFDTRKSYANNIAPVPHGAWLDSPPPHWRLAPGGATASLSSNPPPSPRGLSLVEPPCNNRRQAARPALCHARAREGAERQRWQGFALTSKASEHSDYSLYTIHYSLCTIPQLSHSKIRGYGIEGDAGLGGGCGSR